ncbi:MAG TPA: serine/threonine-protein kinase, partial [Myxococcaceae bacterium]
MDSLLDVGAVVGETYRIQSLIGRGGMGAVWAAEHLRLPGKHVAVKVLLDAAAGGEEMLQRFRREAEIASRLGHPNIVEVLDFNTLPTGQPYIVLEYLQGETLASRLAGGRLQLDEAMAISRQIGSALQAAHRAGVVHRDLKPDNVFLCTPEEDMPTRVKVLDFGISKIRGSQSLRTQDAVLMGTPQYMSPEQATGRNTSVDARTDVFALGAIVYEMLGGQPAFAGGSLAEVVYRVVHGQPTPLRELAPALPENVLAAVERALQKDPAARPQDIGAFILELTGRPLHSFHTGQPRNVDSALGQQLEPTHTPHPTAPTTSWPKTRPLSRDPVRSGAVTVPPPMPEAAPRRLWPFLVAVAVAGVALGGVGVRWASRRAGPRRPVPAAVLPPLDALKRLEPPPPPPAPPTHVLAAEPPPPREPVAVRPPEEPASTPLREKPPGRRHRARPEVAAKGPETPRGPVAVAEPVKAVEPATPAPPATPADGIKPEARKLLDQAEDALSKNKPLDASRLVDQSFYIQRTSLGYAIQVRASCLRHDIGG